VLSDKLVELNETVVEVPLEVSYECLSLM